jgi:hypothetical protein
MHSLPCPGNPQDVAVAKVLPVAILGMGLTAVMPTIRNPYLRAQGDQAILRIFPACPSSPTTPAGEQRSFPAIVSVLCSDRWEGVEIIATSLALFYLSLCTIEHL